ncbi:MAG TPA: hypothetical protein VG722_10035 [Tepidisphaeraceae bacterium]|nr:hypothetical protein [Tepidisphaeraceae bacterium]
MTPSRRNVLATGGIFAGGAAVGCAGGGWHRWFNDSGGKQTSNSAQTTVPPIARCASLVHPKSIWAATDLNRFLDALPEEQLLSMLKSAYTESSQATINALALTTQSHDVQRILTRLLWISSNVLTYEFRDEWSIDYHRLVQWLADKEGVDAGAVNHEPTFELEHRVQLKVFAKIWDKLTPEQRQQVLNQIDKSDQIKDKSAIAAMSGAAALAALSGTIYFAEFAFYTTMSITINTVAGFFGITVPFTGYATASGIISFLSGPPGWIIASILAVGGVALAGRDNPTKTLAVVSQLHWTKVAALIAANVSPTSVFPTTPPPHQP